MMIQDPLNRNRRLRVNDRYDRQEVIVENAISEKKQFQDLPKVSQLTQNSWNFSPYTREDVTKDVVLPGQAIVIVGRLEMYEGVLRPDKYHEHR